jgi:hypothetical protein
MRKILLIAAILAAFVWWTEISNFVSGNAQHASSSVKQWMIDHTPKK